MTGHRSVLTAARYGGDASLIVENRTLGRSDVPPSEGDAHAYLVVRGELASIGVNLVDAMIFDGDFHWWSMHDLERPGQPYDLRADEVGPTARGG